MLEQLVTRVFATRNAAHAAHWRTTSYAQHMALGELYEALPGAIDDLVEAYQGAFTPINPTSGDFVSSITIIERLDADLLFVNANRLEITKGMPALDNLLQTLEGVYLKALYKLRNLK